MFGIPPAGIFLVRHSLRVFWRCLLDQIATTHSLPCRCRHAAWLGMQKNPVRVVGVAEQLLPALPGINLSLRGQRCNTATFPGRTRTCGCLDDSGKAPNPPQSILGRLSPSAGRLLTGVLMSSLVLKKKEASLRGERSAEELPQVSSS